MYQINLDPSFFETFPGIALLVDETFHLKKISTSLLTLLNLTLKDLMGKHLQEISEHLGTEDLSTFISSEQKNIASRDAILFPENIKLKVSWNIHRITSDTGTLTYLLTALPKNPIFPLYNELRQLKRERSDLLNCTPGLLYWKDLESRYLGGNDAWLNLAGFDSNNEVKGLKDEIIFGLEDADDLRANDKEVTEKQITITREERVVLRNGEIKYFIASKMPRYNADGKVIGMIGNSLDITDKKKLEAELKTAKEVAENAKQAQEDLFKNASHDFNTPMASLLGCLDILNNCLACDFTPEHLAMARDFSDKATDSADELTQQFDANLTHIFNITSNNPVMQEKFSIKLLLDQLIRLHKASTVVNDVKMSAILDKNLPHFYLGDYWRLYHILTNLIGNAVKFTHQGSINIDVSMHSRLNKSDNCVLRLQVKDTGIGIAPDKRHAIFEKFTRLTPSYHGLYSGQGLGLSVVKRYIDDLDGQIEVDSDGVKDKGSTFRCFIPFVVALSQSEEGSVNHRVSVKELHPIPYRKT